MFGPVIPAAPTTTTLQKAVNNTFPPAIPTTATNLGTSVTIEGLQIPIVVPSYPIEVVCKGAIQFTANAGIAAGTAVSVVAALVDLNTNALLQGNSQAVVRTTFVDAATGAKFILGFEASSEPLELAPNTLLVAALRVYLVGAASTWTATPVPGTTGPWKLEARAA